MLERLSEIIDRVKGQKVTLLGMDLYFGSKLHPWSEREQLWPKSRARYFWLKKSEKLWEAAQMDEGSIDDPLIAAIEGLDKLDQANVVNLLHLCEYDDPTRERRKRLGRVLKTVLNRIDGDEVDNFMEKIQVSILAKTIADSEQ